MCALCGYVCQEVFMRLRCCSHKLKQLKVKRQHFWAKRLLKSYVFLPIACIRYWRKLPRWSSIYRRRYCWRTFNNSSRYLVLQRWVSGGSDVRKNSRSDTATTTSKLPYIRRSTLSNMSSACVTVSICCDALIYSSSGILLCLQNTYLNSS